MNLDELMGDYDWSEAFSFSDYSKSDVAEIVASDDGCNAGDDWVGVFRLKSGKFLYLSAWCDYTGWCCRSGGLSEVRDTLAEIVRECCTEDDRKRLGLALEDPQ